MASLRLASGLLLRLPLQHNKNKVKHKAKPWKQRASHRRKPAFFHRFVTSVLRMSGWFWNKKPEPPVEQRAAGQVESNAATLQALQDSYEDKMGVAAGLGQNVKRFAQQASTLPKGSPQRIQVEVQQKSAFASMKDMQKSADQLWAQIQGLRRVTSGVQAMQTNVEVHNRYKESNALSAQIQAALPVDDVTDTMDATHEHLAAHEEVSEALAGRTLGGVVDPDEQDAEMAEFLGAQSEGDMAVPARSNQNAPQYSMQQREANDLSDYEAGVLQTLNMLSSPPSQKQPAAVAARSGK